jgi:hypothetical protein
MSRLLPEQRCEVCGGLLAPPDFLPETGPWPEGTQPDYLCIECKRAYYWQADPPRLVLGVPKK